MDGYNFASIIAKIIFPLCAYVLLNILLDRKYMVVDAISEYVVCIPTRYSLAYACLISIAEFRIL